MGAACRPQDAAFVGGCEPGPRHVFTGVECVEMVGCACVGADCESTYELPVRCEAAHANCGEASLSCDEIRAVYEEYTSRDACQVDADCRVTFGQCGVGLGGCHYFMNAGWPTQGLDALTASWQAANCQGGICDCPAPPASAACVGGVCIGAP